MQKTPLPSELASSASGSRGVRRCFSTALAIAFALAAGQWAHADDTPARVLVIPLTGAVPDAPDRVAAFTNAIAKIAGIGGGEVLVADATLADAAAVVGCDVETDGCLDEIAKSLGVSELLFGEVGVTATGQVELTLTYHRPGERRTRAFAVGTGSPADQSRTVAREAAGLLTGQTEPARPEPEPELEPDPLPAIVEPAPAPAPIETPRETRGVRALSWGVLGAGAALVGTAGAFLFLAHDRQSQVDGAPTDTPADFDRLVELEDQGERYARIGGWLMVAGGATVTAGVVLLVLDLRAPSSSSGGLSVAPVLHPGGAGFAVTWVLP